VVAIDELANRPRRRSAVCRRWRRLPRHHHVRRAFASLPIHVGV